jgi:excisionase family DNA binding protein
MNRPRALTVAQVAGWLQIHPETVRRWLRSGKLQGFNLGGVAGWRTDENAVDVFLHERYLRMPSKSLELFLEEEKTKRLQEEQESKT